MPYHFIEAVDPIDYSVASILTKAHSRKKQRKILDKRYGDEYEMRCDTELSQKADAEISKWLIQSKDQPTKPILMPMVDFKNMVHVLLKEGGLICRKHLMHPDTLIHMLKRNDIWVYYADTENQVLASTLTSLDVEEIDGQDTVIVERQYLRELMEDLLCEGELRMRNKYRLN